MFRIRLFRTVLIRITGVWLLALLLSPTFLFEGVISNSPGDRSRLSSAGSPHVQRIVGTLPMKKLLVVEPYHGLGNRLRAYASAAALAKKSGRTLVVIWNPDTHLWANFSELFEIPDNVFVYDRAVLPSLRSSRGHILNYDYNSKGGKDKMVLDRSPADIYVRSAYVLQSQTRVTEEDIIDVLKTLVPASRVQQRVSRAVAALKGLESIVGVHIRMQTNIEMDVPGISQLPANHAAGIESMGPVERKRSLCHFSNFIPKLESAIRTDDDVMFVVASDSPEATDALRATFKGRVLTIQDHRDSCLAHQRSSHCVQGALAEFLVLSQVSSSLILSDWSSASELIRRLSNPTPYTTGCSTAQNGCRHNFRACLQRALHW